MTTDSPYPVQLRGEVDPATSRWLWLFKWLLVIPHLVVLIFLWIAAIVLTVVAFFAILFTGRYPRGIFDFNVGVRRWSWRVSFYFLHAFATDRYPPFSLQPDPNYPADLSVEYPAQLSRGLVLVKWWLLVLPHYVIVGIFAGGAFASVGLIGVLAFIAAVALLFTTRYPRGLFDFLMGCNRWSYRVGTYAMLMTDVYPPFRLDMGGSEPGGIDLDKPTPKQPAAV
jgi:uncharacterized protein DUF4389